MTLKELKGRKAVIEGEISTLHFMDLAVSSREVNQASHISMMMTDAQKELIEIDKQIGELEHDIGDI